jgi:hypothetical protein
MIKTGMYSVVPRNTMAIGESAVHQLYDHHSIFMAKVLILNEDREVLAKYLDVPTFAVGDLFYVQRLIYIIQSSWF